MDPKHMPSYKLGAWRAVGTGIPEGGETLCHISMKDARMLLTQVTVVVDVSMLLRIDQLGLRICADVTVPLEPRCFSNSNMSCDTPNS